jgi:NAD(P)-dependent dehydrogenase (short-subunit alcohol dehydrogenase family)
MPQAPATTFPDFRLDGLRAVVTGAGRGIGRACALALAQAGAEVLAVARSPDDLASLEEEAGPALRAWCADVTSDGFLAELERLERLDVLLNNVGTNRPAPSMTSTTG